jgi:hypothetical protein
MRWSRACSCEDLHFALVLIKEFEQEGAEVAEKARTIRLPRGGSLFSFLCSLRPPVQTPGISASSTRSSKDQAGDPVCQALNVEVDHEPERHVEQFHVAEELRLVDRQDFLNGLGFNQQTAVYEQIESERFLSTESFVLQSNHLLIAAREAAQFQFLD